MRFCMVTTFYPPFHFGGDGTYVRELSRGLVELGHEVEVIHCEDAYSIVANKPPVHVESPEAGIRVHRLKSRLGPLSPIITQQIGRPGLKRSRLRKLLDRDFEVVHFHNISLVGGPAVLRMSNAPVTLYTLHEHWLLCPMHIFWKNREKACDKRECFRCSIRSGVPPQLWRYTRLVRDSLSHVDELLAPSEYTAHRHSDLGVSTPISVLPLFARVEPGPIEDFAAPARARFLYVGRITVSKGIEGLVRSFAELPELELIVAGDGEMLDSLRQTYGDRRNISFLGSIENSALFELYRSATAVVLPSLAPETFGLTVVEGFAYGTPAVVRNAGGCKESVQSTGGGIVCETENEMIGALRRLAAEPDLREQLSRNARAGYERYYTRAHHLSRYLDKVSEIRTRSGTGRKSG